MSILRKDRTKARKREIPSVGICFSFTNLINLIILLQLPAFICLLLFILYLSLDALEKVGMRHESFEKTQRETRIYDEAKNSKAPWAVRWKCSKQKRRLQCIAQRKINKIFYPSFIHSRWLCLLADLNWIQRSEKAGIISPLRMLHLFIYVNAFDSRNKAMILLSCFFVTSLPISVVELKRFQNCILFTCLGTLMKPSI